MKKIKSKWWTKESYKDGFKRGYAKGWKAGNKHGMEYQILGREGNSIYLGREKDWKMPKLDDRK
jgi:hypothetical protein